MIKSISLIILIFIISPIMILGNEQQVIKNRKKAYSDVSLFSTSPNPYTFYNLIDEKDNSLIVLINTSYSTPSFINKKNMFNTNILVKDVSIYRSEYKYRIIDEDKLMKSEYYGLNKDEIKKKYFDVNGFISDYTFVDDIEFIYYILLNGIYIYHGCEASSELYIE